jgi:hypothetical protein
MFIILLIVTFVIAFVVATLVALIFAKPVENILNRIISDDISRAWTKYLKFAIYVVGISGGVRVWELERYITRQTPAQEILQLTTERWVLEIYRTIIGTLQSTAWLLFIFFVFALIAFVIVRVFELRKPKSEA